MKSCFVSLAISTALAVPMFAHAAQSQPARSDDARPNIIVILADDLGYAGLSSFGGEGIHTPHLDNLAENGIKLTNFYATSTVCTPTRVGLMTGLYPQRTGLDHLYHYCAPDEGLSPTEYPSLSQHLKAQGYRTGVFGKWHLGAAPENRPAAQGFDDFVGFLDGNIDFNSKHNTESEVDWWVHHERKAQSGYVTTLLNQAVVDFIDREHESPFFIYLSEAAPHVPMQGPNDPPLRTDDFYAYTVQRHFPQQEYMRRYSEMVASMDDGVGMIMDKLREHGLEENTLVIFTSDNGGEAIGVRHGQVNGAHRGHKNSFYEGGIKVPSLAYWKGTIAPGGINHDLMVTMDLFPTFNALTGARIDTELDGMDLTPALLRNEPLAERDMYWQHTHKLAMRRGDMKLIYHKEKPELYDLARDPLERTDLADDPDYRAIYQAMIQASAEWRSQTAIGLPAERQLGVAKAYASPCKRDLTKFNQGKTYRWTEQGGVIASPGS
ncbi:sulfatase-like hydrolase/transferase [Ferrimonas pelagia]|uniref:Sulfatase N-terminal domain-containing protein n=1 Tax=Ferrimonas pelagia TaxID=1177826 RepID=A0ABP9F2Y2_9GAMM